MLTFTHTHSWVGTKSSYIHHRSSTFLVGYRLAVHQVIRAQCQVKLRMEQTASTYGKGINNLSQTSVKRFFSSTLIERVVYNSMFTFMTRQHLVGHGPLSANASRSLSDSGRVMIPTQRPLSDNSQHSQEKDVHDPNGIRSPNLSKWAAVDTLLRPQGYWERAYSLRKLSCYEG